MVRVFISSILLLLVKATPGLSVEVSEIRFVQDSAVVEHAVKPMYPAMAAARRISGKVLVDVEIDPSGVVRNATVRSGHSILRKAAKEAAMRWVFNTAERPTGMRVARLVFIFRPTSYIPKKGESDFTRPYQIAVTWEGIAHRR